MLHLVTGGSGSGKSAYGENLICKIYEEERRRQPGGSLYYIATMEPYGKETKQKIARHRIMRREKGFNTVECYTGIEKLAQKGGVLYPAPGTKAAPCILLECISNLTANEMFSPKGRGSETAEAVVHGIRLLEQRSTHLAVVTNDVFGEDVPETDEMKRYRQTMAEINVHLAAMAASVTEVVCGIPVSVKRTITGKELPAHMKLVIGGAYQGKTAYARQEFKVRNFADGSACSFEDVYTCEGISHFELLVRRMMKAGRSTDGLAAAIAARNPEIVIVTSEIGCGLVPVDAFERSYREQTGRVCAELAALSSRVDKVICGIGMTIKGGR